MASPAPSGLLAPTATSGASPSPQRTAEYVPSPGTASLEPTHSGAIPPNDANNTTIVPTGNNTNSNTNASASANNASGALPDALAQMAASARVGSEASASARRGRRKKPPPPPQAHPEPRGADEAEARMLWNRVQALPGHGRMVVPGQPAMTYASSASTEIPGGVHNTPAVAAQTQPMATAPPNLVHLARGPLALFVSQGAFPRLGWVSHDLLLPGDTTGVKEEDPRARSRRGGSSQRSDSVSQDHNNNNSNSAGGDNDSNLSLSTRAAGGLRALLQQQTQSEGRTEPLDIINMVHPTQLMPVAATAGATSSSSSSAAALPGSSAAPSSGRGGSQPQQQSGAAASAAGAAPAFAQPRTPSRQQGATRRRASSFTDASGGGGGADGEVQPVPPAGVLRAVMQALRDGDDALQEERYLEECTQWMLDLATAVANERQQFASVKANLAGEVRQLGEQRARQKRHDDAKRAKEKDKMTAKKYLRQDDLDRLEMTRQRVLDCLDEKKRVQRALIDTTLRVGEAESDATHTQIAEDRRLREERRRNEATLQGKLQNAVKQMAELSDAQRKARESSTLEDFQRLAAELTEQEGKMRALNAQSGKLQARIASLRRELSLEAQRGQLLQEKQDGYHAAISTLVRRLEDIERKYAAQSQRELKGISSGAPEGDQAKSGSGSGNNDGTVAVVDVNRELPRVIDQQYAVILQLRADLVRVRQEVAEATALLQEERRALLLAANPSTQPILPRLPRPPADPSRASTAASRDSATGGSSNSAGGGAKALMLAEQAADHHRLPGDLSESAAAFLRQTVFEALRDADENLAPLVRRSTGIDTRQQYEQQRQPNAAGALPPVYPTLELLDPQQRLDVFQFVLRRINTKLLNPLQEPNPAPTAVLEPSHR